MHRHTTTFSLASLTLAAGIFAQAPGAHWSVTTTTGPVPSQRRENPGTASDTMMYVFGGRSGSSGGSVLNDLWAFDGSTWTLKSANGAPGSPPARDRAGVTWDFARDRLIVFGGDDGSGTGLNDTWEWDPTANAWTNITPASGNPSGRRWCSITYDPATGGILLFGGLDNSGVHLGDTWLFVNGTTWIQQSPPGPQPLGRRQHHLVTRRDFGDVILCGGQDASLSAPAKWRTNTWTWNGSLWLQIPTINLPAAVVANDAAYDSIRKRIVLVGGNSTAGVQPTGEISEFDSILNDWVIRWSPNSGDPVISRISRYFMAFVPALGKIYKISGQTPRGGASPTTTCEYQSDAVADFVTSAPGCASPLGMVNLTAPQLPWMTRDAVLEVENAPAGSATILAIGINPLSIPLSTIGLGSASCVLAVDPLLLVPMTPSPTTGRPGVTFPIPYLGLGTGSVPPVLTQAWVLGAGTAWVSNRGDVLIGAL